LVASAPRAEEQLHRLRAVVGGDELPAQEPAQRLGRAGLASLRLQGADLLGAVKLLVGRWCRRLDPFRSLLSWFRFPFLAERRVGG
jgi:hypothetical protein